jgi:protease-4
VASRGRVALIAVGLTLGVIALFLGTVWLMLSVLDEGGLPGGGKIAVVEVEGIIGIGVGSGADSDAIVRTLGEYRDNPSVAASGGYYVAVAASKIYANPGTLTGSIGVIMQMPNVEALMKRVGVDWVVVKAGTYKDLGNPGRPMTAEERRVLQALLDDVHGQFIAAVAEGRKLEREEVARFADGRIFSGTQARALNMVDTLGSLEDAILAAARRADLPTPPAVIRPRRKLSVFDLLSSQLGLGTGLLGRPALPVFKTPLYLMD